MSSLAGITSGATRSLYSASKFAIEAVSESLYAELKPFNIRVLLVEPGAFRTKFADNLLSPAKPLPEDYEGSETQMVLDAVKGMQEVGMEGIEMKLGDVGKGAKAIFDVVVGEGWAEGAEEFLRLPLGIDGKEAWEGKLGELKSNLDGTEGIWRKTGED